MQLRNLDGFYLRKEVDGAWGPVCMSDLDEESRLNWLQGLDQDRLVFVANELAKTIRQLGDTFDLVKE